MVRLVFPPHGTIPRNESEIRLIQFLLENLSSGSSPSSTSCAGNAHQSFILISNLEIPDTKTGSFLGIDAILVAPHAVYLIDVKDWGPHIRADDQFWVINVGRERRNPHRSLEYKRRVLHSLIEQADSEIIRKTWCEGLVVLVSEGVKMDLAGGCRQNTFTLDSALTAFLKDPRRLSSPEVIPDNGLASCHRELADIILSSVRARKYSQFQILDYRVEEILEIQQGYAEYLASSTLEGSSGETQRLRVFTLPVESPPSTRTGLHRNIAQEYLTFEEIASNENLVHFKGFVDEEENRIVEVLDWAEERTLFSVTSDNSLTFEQKIGIIKGIGAGIKAFHERDIVHRNITPDNILITSSGPKILNFHLSTLKEKGYLAPGPGLLNGLNRRYAPCELMALESDSRSKAAADLYSLGVVFYELLCGDLPFADSEELSRAGGSLPEHHLPSKRIPELPDWVDEAVGRLYTLHRREQFQGVDSFLEAMDSLANRPKHEAKTLLPSLDLPAQKPAVPQNREKSDNSVCGALFKMAGEFGALGSNGFKKIANLFQDADLDNQLDEGKPFSKRNLVNLLNYINFQDGTILVNFIHKRHENIISLEAKPRPCSGYTLECIFVREAETQDLLPSYDLLNFLVSDGQKIILVKPLLNLLKEEKVLFTLPDECCQYSFKRARRHLCENVQAELVQNGLLLSGSLLDFCDDQFKVELSLIPSQTFQWINPECTATVILKNSQEILYSGECKIVRQNFGQRTREFVLEAVSKEISRFKRKEYRSPRHKLSPSPNIIFKHPLTGKIINLEVDDISGSGVSVEEYSKNSVLFPGLIIPDLDVEFGGGFKITCKAQVVYKRLSKLEKREKAFICGLAILDMTISDQTRLASIMHQVSRNKSYVSNRVDPDSLWKFFFEAGFVYPQKYDHIYHNKEKFRELYNKLYSENVDLAKHFIYQEKGVIYGHLSMIHFYDNTWIIHHHAASGPKFKKGGIIVLDQIGRFINDVYNLYSSHMSFVACYFRPDNKFPNKVFGGFVDHINNSKGCSCDEFAYLHIPSVESLKPSIETLERANGVLQRTHFDDMHELEGFYGNKAGGLLLSAMDLKKDTFESNSVSHEYLNAGFKRERQLYSLKKDGILKAIFIALVSDLGLNISSLTNCIHAIVLDSKGLSKDILFASLSMVVGCSNYLGQESVPSLVYPLDYMNELNISYDRTYKLWILDVANFGDAYLHYMDNLINRYLAS
jgi:serine/threonine protein kinase